MEESGAQDYYLFPIQDDQLSAGAIIMKRDGTLLGAVSRPSFNKIASSGEVVVRKGNKSYYIIDFEKRQRFMENWERDAITKLNNYFLRIFPEGSQLFESYIGFFQHLRQCIITHEQDGPILDLGSGSGKYLRHLENAILIDISKTAMKQRRIPDDNSLSRIRGDATDLPFKRGSFSVILCSFLLEHVADPFDVLKETARALRSGGFLIMAIPSLNLRVCINTYILRKRISLPIFHCRTFGPFKAPACISLATINNALRKESLAVEEMVGINIASPKHMLGRLMNSHLGRFFPFNYFGNQTIIVAKKT